MAIAPARPDPGPRPTAATATPTATPTADAEAADAAEAAPKLAVKLSCKTSGGGKRITVSCTATGKDATKKTTLRFQIMQGQQGAGDRAAEPHQEEGEGHRSGRARRSRRARYTLRITLTQTGGTLDH